MLLCKMWLLEEEDGRMEIIHLGLKLHVMIAAACPAAVT